ncbi:MAG: DsrE/DsrF/DrsH-like family protein [Candidatus Hydrothermarchaeota archaeon]
MAKKLTIICSSNDFERVYAAFNIANGAASFGMDVTIFFTFWGLEAIKKDGLKNITLSKKDYLGIGSRFMKKKMKEKNVPLLQEQFDDLRELGVKMIACDMSMEIMGIKKEDFVDDVEVAGIGTYINTAKDSEINLFI